MFLNDKWQMLPTSIQILRMCNWQIGIGYSSSATSGHKVSMEIIKSSLSMAWSIFMAKLELGTVDTHNTYYLMIM